jgi:hypothetical protein
VIYKAVVMAGTFSKISSCCRARASPLTELDVTHGQRTQESTSAARSSTRTLFSLLQRWARIDGFGIAQPLVI